MWYLMGEIALLLALALFLGLFVGWLLWGRRRREVGAREAAPPASTQA